MDFFTATAAGSDALAAVSSPTQLPAPTTSNHDSTTTDAFAEAINARYSRKGSTVLIPLSPASEHPSASPPNSSIAVPTHKLQAPAMASASSSSSEEFIAVNPTSVRDVLEGALVIDIRSHNAYALARLPHALSLSVPSTLLKRPLFSLDKLAQMLSSVPARERFSRWPEAPSILVYDADSGVLNEGGNLVGLLRKFRKEGFTRKLYWLKGGFKAVWREVLDVVDQNPMVEEDDVPAVAAPTPSGTLLPKHLPMRAFTMASTTTSRQVPLTPAVNQGSVDPFSLRLPQTTRTSHTSMTLPLPSTPAASTSSSFSRPSSLSLHLPPASKPTTIPEGKTLHLFPPAQRSAVDVSSLPTGGQSAAYNVVPRPHYKSMPGGHSMAFNPFFDNIRQNIELSGGRGSGEGIPLKLPRRVRRRVEELPFEWLREIGRRSGTVVDETEESSDMDVVVENEAKGVAHNATSAVNISRSIVAGTKKSKKRRRKTKQSSNLTRLHPSSSSSSSSSESNSPPPDSSELSYSASPSKANSKAGSASPPPGLASISLNPLATQPQAATSSPQVTTTDPSEGESSGDDLAKALAMQFYKIELGEQRRLMGVMEHHSKESTTFSTSAQSTAPSSSSGALPGGYAGVRVLPGLKSGMPMGNSTSSSGSSSNATVQPRSVHTSTSSVSQASTSKSEEGAAQIAFPYSITAGVEKGEKNRYRNIWPFEHARVRLQKSCPEDDDYMNASYVQPLGTNKRYIATQGPLPATFTDFWTLCWQENVHVIVMLTREVESALIKCGNYWNEGDYGSLQLKLISTTDSPEREKRRKERESSSGFFNFPQVPEVQRPGEQHEDHTIRRIFQLTNKKFPQAKPRIVTQLQYLDWPDLDVPKDPRGLLELMKEVDEIVENTRVEGGMQWGEGPWSKSPIGTPPKEQRPPSVETLGGRGDVDPVTGVATHAVGRAPVLLHCSAGVGRTGGFIAVDAVLDGVRREMRKRRQQQQQYQVKSDVSSVTSSLSQSPSSLPGEEHAEGMDVDRGPFDKAVDTGLTMPMEVGGNEVHVPIAGLRNGQAPMDVDSVEANSKKDSQLKASPALLKEVKSGHAKAIAALADNDRHSASATPDNHGEIAQAESPQRDVGPSDSSSGASSTPRSTSLSTRSVMSSNHTSTASLTQAVKAVDPTLGSSDSSSSLQQDKSTVRVASSSTSQAGPAMDSWRTVGPKWERDVVLASPRGMAFDYVEPRRLHDNRSPPLLSSYDEPIRRVIEDMREQRMSLCQSLRQYVFVHRAIIEGVLKIMDEEKNRKRGTVEDVEMAVADTDKSVRPPSMPSVFGKPAAASKSSDMLVSPMPLRPPGLDRAENIGLGPALVLDEHGARRTPLSQESPLLEVLVPTGSPMSPRTKRQASPTELVSEDSQGAPRLTKRASVKRRPATPRVSKEEDSGVQLGSLMLSSPPPA